MVVVMDRLYVLAGPKDDTAAPGTEGEEVRGAVLRWSIDVCVYTGVRQTAAVNYLLSHNC